MPSDIVLLVSSFHALRDPVDFLELDASPWDPNVQLSSLLAGDSGEAKQASIGF